MSNGNNEVHPMTSRVLREQIVSEMAKVRPCRHCLVSGQDMNKCSRCKQVYYCGKDCQLADWPSHRLNCKRLIEMKQETREQVEKLRREWMNRVKGIFAPVLVQCFSQEDFRQQPPKKDIVFCFEFNYNYATYMPVGPPVITNMIRYPPALMGHLESNYKSARAGRLSSEERTHFMHVVFRDEAKPLVCNIDMAIIENQCREYGWSSTEYSHENFCKLLSTITLPNYLYDPSAHSTLYEVNLKKQFSFFQDATTVFMNQIAFQRFIINAYRMNEKKNLRGKQVLICYFLFDFHIGKMKRFTRYELVSMELAKGMVPARIGRQCLCFDMPNYLPALLVEEWGRDLFAVSYSGEAPPPDFEFWQEEQSLETANHFFNELKALQFPSQGLEANPMLE